MRLIPVLDLLDGVVVRGVAGERDRYRPIQSQLVTSPEPLAVARAFREHFGLTTHYVADLDAITGCRPNLDCYRQLADDGFSLLVDAGVRNVDDAAAALAAGAASVIAGLETSSGPEHLRELCVRFGRERVIFSLDLKQGRPLGDVRPWETDDPLTLAERAIGAGIERAIVLDLAQVGVGSGVGTAPLCQALLARHPGLRLLSGGGVRNGDDLRKLMEIGLEGVLVASALHNGQLHRDDVERFV